MTAYFNSDCEFIKSGGRYLPLHSCVSSDRGGAVACGIQGALTFLNLELGAKSIANLL